MEVEKSIYEIKCMGLVPHNEWSKNWDNLHAVKFILERGNVKSNIMDMGCATYGVILPWLETFGYCNLYGCDTSFVGHYIIRNIKYYKMDLQSTVFPDNMFDFITCMSVIEHGVNIEAYFKEASRLLKKGGYLITSTDYWKDGIDADIKVFTKNDINNMIKIANMYGFELEHPIDFEDGDKVVSWKGYNYTFIIFILKKVS